jgi:hypothetical protein
MVMAKVIKKIGDKLAKVNETFTVNMYDNGFMFEIGGRDSNEDWKNVKILCSDMEQVVALFNEAASMPRND